jgi:hypothetical protein
MDFTPFQADVWTLCATNTEVDSLRTLLGQAHPHFTDMVCTHVCTEVWPAYKDHLVVRLTYGKAPPGAAKPVTKPAPIDALEV